MPEGTSLQVRVLPVRLGDNSGAGHGQSLRSHAARIPALSSHLAETPMTNLVIQDGIGYIQTGNQLVSATPAEYVAEIERLSSALRTANANHERFEREWYLRGDEIERLQRDLAAARLLLDERIALVHPLTDEPKATLAKTASGGTLRCGQHGLPNEIQGDRIGCRKCFEVNRKR